MRFCNIDVVMSRLLCPMADSLHPEIYSCHVCGEKLELLCAYMAAYIASHMGKEAEGYAACLCAS
jgi:hypothetical protein